MPTPEPEPAAKPSQAPEEPNLVSLKPPRRFSCCGAKSPWAQKGTRPRTTPSVGASRNDVGRSVERRGSRLETENPKSAPGVRRVADQPSSTAQVQHTS